MIRNLISLFLVTTLVALTGCSTAPKSETGRKALELKADQAVSHYKEVDPSLAETFFKDAKGYAVFPKVGKGAIGIGGAYGKGVLYEGDKVVGYCDLTQGSIGFQLGGQAYSEIIFFENENVLDEFKKGNVEFSAQASAVAASADAAATADYDHGVAVFTLNAKGLMYEASIGGQGFSYLPK